MSPQIAGRLVTGPVRDRLTAVADVDPDLVAADFADPAAAANAEPVAEYTLASILFANKRVLELAALYRDRRAPLDVYGLSSGIGNYRRTIGIIGASRIGRRVIELLRPFDLDVLVADPYLTEDLGVRTSGWTSCSSGAT
ncbi:NAD(P)-dependent oxidoreductase [Nonomuraea fuscirosea]|uniref:NAD(P)-dependent oxidoreductase n=1 Tax=Nonomuraea fuscirosea TaxID=1291556 RepID=UPI003496643C